MNQVVDGVVVRVEGGKKIGTHIQIILVQNMMKGTAAQNDRRNVQNVRVQDLHQQKSIKRSGDDCHKV